MKRISKRNILSIILKLIVIIFAFLGVFKCILNSSNTFMGGKMVLMYFTIQSNIIIGLVCLIGLYKLIFNKKISNLWYLIKYISTMSITLTGAVFCFVLAPTMGDLVWNEINFYTHVIVPICAIIDFFVTGIESNIQKKYAVCANIPPLLYFLFASIGYFCKWEFAPGINYPYFFLNWGSKAGAFGISNELPYLGCVWWLIILSILILITNYFYLYILDFVKKQINKK